MSISLTEKKTSGVALEDEARTGIYNWCHSAERQSLKDYFLYGKENWRCSDGSICRNEAIHGEERNGVAICWGKERSGCANYSGRTIFDQKLYKETKQYNIYAKAWKWLNMEKATSKEIKQVKTIIRNMQKYAIKNDCVFIKSKWLNSDDYVFKECGFNLHFRVDYKLSAVFVESSILTFKEFVKFQEHFLKNVFDIKDKKQQKRLNSILSYIKIFEIKPLGFDINSKETTLFYKYSDVDKLWQIMQDLNDLFTTTYVWCEDCVFDVIEDKHDNVKNLNDDAVYLCIDVVLR